MRIIGLDIGGSKIDAILWDGRKIVRAEKIKTPKNREVFLRVLVGVIKGLMGERGMKGVKGIGIGMAGALDLKRGAVMNSPNMKFINNFPLVRFLQKKFKKPVAMDNDTHCFLLAEARYGLARGKKNIVALTLGTGVGGGIMIEGKLVHGKDGAAGELGQMIIAGLLTPSLSSFQRRGRKGEEFFSVEDLISAHGFAWYSRKGPRELEILARGGDRRMIGIFNEVGKYLGIALANIINIFNPEIIVIGGGISRARTLLTIPARKEMAKHTLLPKSKLPPIVVSRLEHAGALGAVSLFT